MCSNSRRYASSETWQPIDLSGEAEEQLGEVPRYLDVDTTPVAGSVDGSRVVLSLNRNQLNGAMLARLPDDNTMNVTVSVRVDEQMVPVIGMNLKRIDTSSVGSIARE